MKFTHSGGTWLGQRNMTISAGEQSTSNFIEVNSPKMLLRSSTDKPEK